MALPRFHVPKLKSTSGQLELGPNEARHARASRRLSVTDRVMLFDGAGYEATGAIASISPGHLTVGVDEITFRERPRPCLALAVALPKGPRQTMLIEKCTELGVARVRPVVTERSVADASSHRRRKWLQTAIEAAKQSGQCWLPEIDEPRSLPQVVEDLGQYDRTLLAATEALPDGAAAVPVAHRIEDLAKADTVLAFVGPEGGWTDGEVARLVAAGAEPISLGANVLRIETAAVALAAVIHAVARSG